MTSDYLDLPLVTVTAQHNDLETQAFDLIEWARAHGKLADLVLGARYANPDNPDLFVFAQKLGVNSSDQGKSTLEAFVGSNLDLHRCRRVEKANSASSSGACAALTSTRWYGHSGLLISGPTSCSPITTSFARRSKPPVSPYATELSLRLQVRGGSGVVERHPVLTGRW